jgi:hypothetical protein
LRYSFGGICGRVGQVIEFRSALWQSSNWCCDSCKPRLNQVPHFLSLGSQVIGRTVHRRRQQGYALDHPDPGPFHRRDLVGVV